MNILVFGANGMLGSALVEELRPMFNVIPLTHADCDVTDRFDVFTRVVNSEAHVIINCAAMLNVRECAINAVQAFEVNCKGSANIALASREIGAKCIYVSTGCVFGVGSISSDEFKEKDAPHPSNVYATTKYAGEDAVFRYSYSPYVVRVSTLFGPHKCRAKGYNFVELVQKSLLTKGVFEVDTNCTVTPSYSLDVAKAVRELLEGDYPSSIYHFVNSGKVPLIDFAREVQKLSKLKGIVKWADNIDHFRPLSTALQNNSPIQLRSWYEALADYCKEPI